MARKRQSPPFMLKSQSSVKQGGFKFMGSSPILQVKEKPNFGDTSTKSSDTWGGFDYTRSDKYEGTKYQGETTATSNPDAKKTDESTDLSGIVKYSASVIAPKTQKKVVDYAAEKTIKKKIYSKGGKTILAKTLLRATPIGTAMMVYDAVDFGVQIYNKGLKRAWEESTLKGGLDYIGSLFSDERLKENITRTGTSKSGIPTYEFNYKNDNQKWEGAMAQDLLSLGNADSVVVMQNGYYGVNYDNIDVDMKKV